MKTSSIFYLLASIWSIDFFTTIIALTYPNLYEANRLLSPFFEFGFFGFIFVFVVTMIILYLSSFLIFKLSNYQNNPHAEFIQGVAITVFWVLEVQTILNNVGLMI
jgi:hypothetical protein